MFKKILFTLTLLVLACLQLSASVTALTFGDFYFISSNHAVDANNNKLYDNQNGFVFRRIYLTYDSDLSDKLKARVRFELNGQSFNTAASALTTISPYLKDAYIAYQYLPLHSAMVGMQESLAFNETEKFFGYRQLEKTMIDLYKVRSSRDTGISLKGSFDDGKMFNYTIQLGNYTGTKSEVDKYKQISGTITVNPTANIVLLVNADSSTISDTKKSTLIQGFAGYKDDWGRIGVNYANEKVTETNKADVNFGMFSAYAVGILSKEFEAVVRYDVTFDPQPYGQADFFPIEKGYKTNIFIAGVAWNVSPKFQIMPNVKTISYTEVNGKKKIDGDTYFSVTFFYQF